MGLFDWTRSEPETARLDTGARLSDGSRVTYVASRQTFIREGGLRARCAEISAAELDDALRKARRELARLTGERVTEENYTEIRERFKDEVTRQYSVDADIDAPEMDDELYRLEARVEEIRREAAPALSHGALRL